MGTEIKVVVGGLKGKMQLTGKGHSGHEVAIDYVPPMGEDKGFTSLELLLVSLASCSSHAIQFLLGKMGKKVVDLEVHAAGDRRMDEHPTLLTAIRLSYRFTGETLDQASVEKAIKMAEEKYCPVWAMMKNNVAVSWTFSIEQ